MGISALDTMGNISVTGLLTPGVMEPNHPNYGDHEMSEEEKNELDAFMEYFKASPQWQTILMLSENEK